MDTEKFSKCVRCELIKHDMTYEQAANLIDVSPDTFSSWLQGKHQIPLNKAASLADIFGITLDELAGRN